MSTRSRMTNIAYVSMLALSAVFIVALPAAGQTGSTKGTVETLPASPRQFGALGFAATLSDAGFVTAPTLPGFASSQEQELQGLSWSLDTCLQIAEIRAQEATVPLDVAPSEVCESYFGSSDRTRTSENAGTPDEARSAAQSYSSDYGVSADEASSRIGSQEQLGDVASIVRLVAGDRVAHVGIVHSPTYGLMVKLNAGPHLPLIDQILQASGVPATTVWDAPWSVQQLIAESKKQSETLHRLIPGVQIGIDEASGSMVLTVSGKPDDTSSIRAGIEKVLPTDIAVPVRIDIVDGLVGFANRGGNQLYYPDDTPRCTSAFTIRAASGDVPSDRRLLTAAHCGSISRWRDWATTAPSAGPASVRTARRDGYRDFEWMQLTTTPLPEMWGSSTAQYQAISVTGVADRAGMMGKYVCHRGLTSGWSCGTVNSITDPWGIGTQSHTWITADGPSSKCIGGDSGGNVYSGSTAYGILSGCSGTRTIFMAIRYIEADNVRVLYG